VGDELVVEGQHSPMEVTVRSEERKGLLERGQTTSQRGGDHFEVVGPSLRTEAVQEVDLKDRRKEGLWRRTKEKGGTLW
jgi:hypothetical protein